MNMLVNPVAWVEANSSLVNRFAGLLVGPLSASAANGMELVAEVLPVIGGGRREQSCCSG